jgi:hypothetical protein
MILTELNFQYYALINIENIHRSTTTGYVLPESADADA